jgi:hypothetical protein
MVKVKLTDSVGNTTSEYWQIQICNTEAARAGDTVKDIAGERTAT